MDCLSCRIRLNVSTSMWFECCLRSSSGSAHFHVSWLSDFIFYQKPLYKSLHQSFFYSFITILPSESGVRPHYSTMVICNSLLLLKSLPINVINCIKFYVNCSALTGSKKGGRNTCSFRSPWVTLPLNLFFPTHFVLFPSALIWAVIGEAIYTRISDRK
jgi:hypothetical protein